MGDVCLALISFFLNNFSEPIYLRIYQTDFHNFLPYESALGADDRSKRLFSDFTRDVAMANNFVA